MSDPARGGSAAPVVRPAELGDVAEILAMVGDLAEYERAAHEVLATHDDLTHALFGAEPALFGHVALHPNPAGGRELAGFALWFLNYSTWLGSHGIYLEDLYVRNELRGSGFGKSLLQHLARMCVERDYARLEWSVLDWNAPAIGFYESLGAVAQHQWTVHRLTGPALLHLGSIQILSGEANSA